MCFYVTVTQLVEMQLPLNAPTEDVFKGKDSIDKPFYEYYKISLIPRQITVLLHILYSR